MYKTYRKGGCFHINNVPPQVVNTPLNGGRLDEVAVIRKGPDAECGRPELEPPAVFVV